MASITWPTSQGSTMPPKLSPSKIIPLTEAVSVSDCPARVKPIGHRGAMQKPNPNATTHKTKLEAGMSITRARVDRQRHKATRTICGGVIRVAMGMESRRPRVNDSQNPAVRYARNPSSLPIFSAHNPPAHARDFQYCHNALARLAVTTRQSRLLDSEWEYLD